MACHFLAWKGNFFNVLFHWNKKYYACTCVYEYENFSLLFCEREWERERSGESGGKRNHGRGSFSSRFFIPSSTGKEIKKWQHIFLMLFMLFYLLFFVLINDYYFLFAALCVFWLERKRPCFSVIFLDILSRKNGKPNSPFFFSCLSGILLFHYFISLEYVDFSLLRLSWVFFFSFWSIHEVVVFS